MQANIADAHSALANVVSMVTAKRKVNDDERNRLQSHAMELYRLLQEVNAARGSLTLDDATLQRLGSTSWSALLGEFNLVAPGLGNIGDWLNVIDSWMRPVAGALGQLRRTALDPVAGDRAPLARNRRQCGCDGGRTSGAQCAQKL